jgi:hypothetical protein
MPSGARGGAAEQRRDPDPSDVALTALTQEERDVLLKVAEILRRLKFGTIVLVVQDGKVVQIEMAEKFRLK